MDSGTLNQEGIMNQPTIKAIYNGMQEGAEPFELWTILEALGEDHPMLSLIHI